MKDKIVKILEENIEENLHNLCLGRQIFLKQDGISMDYIKKDKFILIKINVLLFKRHL